LLTSGYHIYRGGADWFEDGMLNEHIVATTIVCLSSVNVAPYSIYLEVEADLDPEHFHYMWDELPELEQVFEVGPLNHLGGDGVADPAVQRLIRVQLPEGRLLALPSVLRRNADNAPTLLDPTKPGRLQMLVLYLVDPHYRICSTRNVPPQQHDWWASAASLDQALGNLRIGEGRGLPREVADQISAEMGEWPMSEDEAREAVRIREEDEDVFKKAVEHGVLPYEFDWE
jgi:hypothetical protein